MITRRTALAGLAALSLPPGARADTAEQLSVNADGGSQPVLRHAANVAGKRPGVIMLHGAHGIERKPRAYERYASALTATGIDAYVLRYLNASDTAAITSATSSPTSRDAYYTARFDGWANTVSATATDILNRADSSGRIGLLGFSLGGYVAANTAARDERVNALAVLYGGMPEAAIANVRHLPPLIELHGEADTNVPIAKGKQLVELAKSVGAQAELVSYVGRQHGFDFSDTDPLAADAIDRVCRFFKARL